MNQIYDVLEKYIFEDPKTVDFEDIERDMKEGLPGNYTPVVEIVDNGIRITLMFDTPEDELIFKIKYPMPYESN